MNLFWLQVERGVELPVGRESGAEVWHMYSGRANQNLIGTSVGFAGQELIFLLFVRS